MTTLGTLGDLHPTDCEQLRCAKGNALELRQRRPDVVFITHQIYQ